MKTYDFKVIVESVLELAGRIKLLGKKRADRNKKPPPTSIRINLGLIII